MENPVIYFLTKLVSDYLPVILMPVVVIGIWALIFYNGSPAFTQIIIQLGYIFFAIPVVIFIFLTIPILMFTLALRDSQYNDLFLTFLVFSFISLTLISQYFYIKRKVIELEQKEGMPIIAIIKREFNSEWRKERKNRKIKTVEENKDFFSEITDLNQKKREEEKADREKLRRVLTRAEEPRPEPSAEQ